MIYLLLFIAIIGGHLESELIKVSSPVDAGMLCDRKRADGDGRSLCQLWVIKNGQPELIGELE